MPIDENQALPESSPEKKQTNRFLLQPDEIEQQESVDLEQDFKDVEKSHLESIQEAQASKENSMNNAANNPKQIASNEVKSMNLEGGELD